MSCNLNNVCKLNFIKLLYLSLIRNKIIISLVKFVFTQTVEKLFLSRKRYKDEVIELSIPMLKINAQPFVIA